MASNQRRKGLDQSPGNTLNALDRVLADMAAPQLAADEFTTQMILDKMPELTQGIVEGRLRRFGQSGLVTKRRCRIGGKICNAYRYVSQENCGLG